MLVFFNKNSSKHLQKNFLPSEKGGFSKHNKGKSCVKAFLSVKELKVKLSLHKSLNLFFHLSVIYSKKLIIALGV